MSVKRWPWWIARISSTTVKSSARAAPKRSAPIPTSAVCIWERTLLWSWRPAGFGCRPIDMDLEKTLLRKVGEAVGRFKMIRDGDRVAVALSGGKDSATLLEILLLLQKRAPINFSVCAFTVEQGKFLSPIGPMGEYLKQRGIPWTYYTDNASLNLLEDQPDHGCDVCSRFRR